MRQSQSAAILEALKRGDQITSLEALEKFGCMRLASRICDLRQDGHPIFSKTIKNKQNGKRYKKYFMVVNAGEQIRVGV